MPRPNTIPGLVRELFRVRFPRLGRLGRGLALVALVAGIFGAGFVAAQLFYGARLGTCPAGAAAASREPCPYVAGQSPCDRAAARDLGSTSLGADDDIPPCRR